MNDDDLPVQTTFNVGQWHFDPGQVVMDARQEPPHVDFSGSGVGQKGQVITSSAPAWESPFDRISAQLDRANALTLRLLGLPPEGLGFLRAALEAPQDRSLWLVLADWLESQGETEAEAKLRKMGVDRRPRFSDVEPREDVPCAWCEKVKPTTLNEIWCEADPAGRLTRLCAECGSCCAGG
jgi:uncharacterized protein (TIGR02996 family)